MKQLLIVLAIVAAVAITNIVSAVAFTGMILYHTQNNAEVHAIVCEDTSLTK